MRRLSGMREVLEHEEVVRYEGGVGTWGGCQV